ncbi:hypothetical protein [Silvimonas amylolytica]|uniref:DUF2917 domain-containing protein n=1 Tax=Silvimonas amylolytica TaxID=449663 RepID=A0ABQ2PQG7_9NEIS|nr:hypothetical protein [Silvimonas amylolytica]GGP27232.1 hypothetical protein GCM10010971_30510 [Silvimonas amylolytica]
MSSANGLPMRLYNAQLLSIRDRSVRVTGGKAWLTDAKGKDLILSSGDCYRVRGLAVIEAIGATDLVFEPAAGTSDQHLLIVS